MGRKKDVGGVPAVVTVPPGTLVGGAAAIPPDFTSVIQSESLTMAEKRRSLLEKLGLKGTKRKYATVEERKEASKVRREKRKSERAEALAEYGLEPKKKGPKLTKEQRKAKRKARGKKRRGFMREMAIANPELAKTYGIDPARFKKAKIN